jgi:glycosyltransferase involved in cell wall biosynthesis
MRCILSVIAQEYPNFEHIIVDGASQDGTCDTLKSFPHLIWISEPDTGEANAINKALAMASGDIICWLNADDFLCLGVFKKIADLFAENSELEAVYGDAEFRSPHGLSFGFKRPRAGLVFADFLRWWNDDTLPHQPSMFFSRKLLDRVGRLNESLHFSIDLELWLRCALETDLHYVADTLSIATQRGDCKSHNTVPQQIESHWRVVLPFLRHISFDERVDFWSEYYAGRVTGSMRFVQQDPCRFPDTEEAVLALVRVLSYSAEPRHILQSLFWAPQTQQAVEALLTKHGLICAADSLIGGGPVVAEGRVDRSEPTIVLDGIFFQYRRGGICRMWTEVLKQWSTSEFARHLVVIDRGGTAPRFSGVQYRVVPPQDFSRLERETNILEAFCREERAALFISTYFTSVRTVPTLVPVYDMIPEKLGVYSGAPECKAKRQAIELGSAFACISENTKRDLIECYPSVATKSLAVTLCGVNRETFAPASPQQIAALRSNLGLTQPYFVLAGGGPEYKNTRMLFDAMQRLASQASFAVVNTGGPYSAEQLGVGNAKCTVISGGFSDTELRLLYAGASALVYPSLYEGFGLPILEAMSSGCPVITTTVSSIPEVAGEAAIYVDTPEALARAICDVHDPAIREGLIAAGYARATTFSWTQTAYRLRQLAQNILAEATERSAVAQLIDLKRPVC